MNTVYEVWVRALRTWQADPSTDLTTLPQLAVESLPPPAYERLFAHLFKALVAVNDRAWQQFSRTWAAATSDHERTVALVTLRAMLGRQLQIAQNPRLPSEVRDAVRKGAERDIASAQRELESNAVRPTAGGRSDRDASDRLLQLLRTNSLTAILAPEFPVETLYNRTVRSGVQRAPGVETSPYPAHYQAGEPARPMRRRTIFTDD